MPALRIPASFKKKLAKKPPAMQGAILECVQRLGDDPQHPGLRTSSLSGHPGVFYARVDRANRVTFEWDGDEIVLRVHCNHDILKRP